MHSSYHQLSQEAKKGDARARHELGEMYAKGIGVPKDHKQAARWYRLAAEQGYTLAQVQLASMFMRGEGVPKSIEKAAEWYQKAASKGHLESCKQIGHMYAEGKGVIQDFQQSVMWLRKSGTQMSNDELLEYFKKSAEERDSAQSYYSLALLIESKAVGGTAAELQRLLEIAAEKGNTAAMLKMALHLRSASHDPESKKLSQAYLKKAHAFGAQDAQWELAITTFEENTNADNFGKLLEGAQSGHARSQLIVAQTLLEGKLFERNWASAVSLLRQAMTSLPEAKRLLGRVLCEGEDESEIAEGLHWLKECADAGDSDAMYALGTFNRLYTDEREQWLLKAAANKHGDAQYELSKLYADDEGRRLEWLGKAAEAGHVNAQYELACHLSSDVGNESEKLRQLLQSAAEANHPHSCFLLGEFYLSEKYNQVDLDLGSIWLMTASDLGVADASFRLARLEKDFGDNAPKLGLSRDELLRRAADQGHPQALYELGLDLISADEKDKGLELIKQASADCLDAAIYLARYYCGADEFMQGMPYLRAAADGGDAESCFVLAQHILDAFENEEEERILEAIRYLEQAAQRNHAQACYSLGVLIARRADGDHDFQHAAHLFAQSAEAGVVEGQYRYAVMLLSGVGCDCSPEKAKQLLLSATAKGHLDAMVLLAKMLKTSENPTDVIDASELLFAAAASGHVGAICELALSTISSPVQSSQGPLWASTLVLANHCGEHDAITTLRRLFATSPDDYKNIGNAIFWYEQGVTEQNADALFWLSECLFNGNGVECDAAKAQEYCRKAAGLGHAAAQLQIGDAYYFGDGVDQDYAQAAHWYRRSADQDNATAQFNLASMYLAGEGGEADVDEARRLYTDAAAQGHGFAQLELAQLLLDKSDRSPSDVEQAIHWLETAAYLGLHEATYRLGCFYREFDADRAFKAFQQAAEKQHSQSQIAMAEMLFSRGDHDRGLNLLRDAWISGCAEAAVSLGEYYLRTMVPPDPSASLNWYRKAAEAGLSAAQVTLAMMYLTGLGTEENAEQAAHWLEMAASQGNIEGCYLYGLTYTEGTGRPKDFEQAIHWLEKAAQAGHAEAVTVLAKVTK